VYLAAIPKAHLVKLSHNNYPLCKFTEKLRTIPFSQRS